MSDNTYENVNPEMIRKRKAKAQETPEQRQARLNRESERKRQKNNKKEMERDDERVIRLAHKSNRKRVLRARNKNQLQDQQINEPNDNEHIQREPDNRNMHVRSTSSTNISEDDHK
ncbi:8942_t:CDS:2, partial [Rhizophagus irregularis]